MKSGPLDRALHLLDIVAGAGREMSLVEIANASGLPQSSAFRLTASLRGSGMLHFDANRKVYSLGPRAERLALLVKGQRAIEFMVTASLQSIAELARETSFFVLRGEFAHRLIKYHVPDLGARAFIHPGFDFPEHATAAGKAIRAFITGENATWGKAKALTRYQTGTITDARKLEAMYAGIRKHGIATNDSELDSGVYSMAAPVFLKKNVIGALGIVGPRERAMAMVEEVGLVDALKTAANELSTLVGL